MSYLVILNLLLLFNLYYSMLLFYIELFHNVPVSEDARFSFFRNRKFSYGAHGVKLEDKHNYKNNNLALKSYWMSYIQSHCEASDFELYINAPNC